MPKTLLLLLSFSLWTAASPCGASGDGFAWEGPLFFGPGLDNRSNDNRRALAAVVWDDGSGPALYVGGNFRVAGGFEVNHIARWDGTEWSPLGSGMSGESLSNTSVPGVDALAVYDGDLIAAGNFTFAGGVPANYIARWDGESWSPLGSGMGGGVPGEPPLVRALTVYDGDLIAGGDFPEAGGTAVNFVAGWDGSEWSALTGSSGTGLDGPVAALAEFDGALIVGGAYTTAGGIPANNIARWDGSEWSTLTSGVSGGLFGSFVTALTPFDDALIVGGGFTQAGGEPANNVALWDGNAWSALATGTSDSVQDLTVFEGALIAGGLFGTAGGVPANGIARWDGDEWSAVGAGVGGSGIFSFVTMLLSFDGALFAGGQFHQMDGVEVNNIARWDGVAWSALGESPGNWLDGPVLALTQRDGDLFAGGAFTRAGGVPMNHIARWDGEIWSPLADGMDGGVTALAVYDGELIAGGSFTEAGGQAIEAVARWDGEQWSALGTGVGNGPNAVSIRAVAVYDGDLIVGGQLGEAGGVPVNEIARWDGEQWSALGTGVSGGGIPEIDALTVFEGALIAGGSFTEAGGVTANHVARWDGEAWTPLGDGMGPDGRVWALAVHDGQLIAAGGYIEDGFLHQVVRWDGETWTPLEPDLVGVFVVTLGVFDGDLIAGGLFSTAGDVTMNNVARWDGGAWTPLAGPAGAGTDEVVRALTVFDPDGAGPMPEKLVAGGGFVLTGGVGNWYLGFYGSQEVSAPELTFDPASLDFGEVEVGTTSPPQTAMLHNTSDADATALIFGLPGNGFDADPGACGDALPAGESCAIAVTFTPTDTGPAEATIEVTTDEGVAATLDLSGEGVTAGTSFAPVALQVDPTALASDGNGVFEPGERVEVAPAWSNEGDAAAPLSGAALDFTGPAGATYTLVEEAADYGTLDPGQTASCLDADACYEMEVDAPAVRPATLWEATFDETLSDATTQTWTLHIGDSFTDVPRSSLFYRSIETLLHHGVTGGCTATTYCPAAANTRDQIPVFLLKALEGGAYVPPACVGGEEMFADVPASSPFCRWIKELAGRGVTAGCGGGNYCPGNSVTRDQMAVFLLKTLEGPSYVPPTCAGVFGDVPCPSLFANWVEDLVARGITAGCGGGNYCPSNPVSRDQMAVFLSKTFDLNLYGP